MSIMLSYMRSGAGLITSVSQTHPLFGPRMGGGIPSSQEPLVKRAGRTCAQMQACGQESVRMGNKTIC